MSQKTVIFFDMDLTLIHNQFSRKLFGEIFAEMLEASGKTPRELGRELGAENARRQTVDPDNVLTMDWDDIVQGMAQKYGVTLSQNVDDLWLQYVEREGVLVLDDAPTILQQLKAEHRQIVIATKGLSKYQNPILESTGLRPYFDDFLMPDITGYLKTSPAYFNKYHNQDVLCIQVGDHYYDDVMCARRNGFYSVMRAPLIALADYDPFARPQHLDAHFDTISTYPETGSDVRPDAVILSLAELPAVVAHIESKSN